MVGAEEQLPNDIEALKALVTAERAARKAAEEKASSEQEGRERLERLLQELRRALYGRRSEKIDADQLQLALEDIETAIAIIDAEGDAKARTEERPRRKRDTNRGSLPLHLPRVEVTVEPETTACACGTAMHVIGEDVSERLDIIPAQFRVLVTRRPRYACRSCENIVQATAPARLVEGGIPTETMVAHVLVSKYADHLPLYRQAQIYARQGIELDRSTLADWVGRAAFELKPVFGHLIGHLTTSPKLFMDETRAPVLEPGRRRTRNGYFWALARDDRPWSGSDPPGVAYLYAPGRGSEHVTAMMKDFAGILQVDGYGAYRSLTNPARPAGPVTLAYCWSHVRRRFYEFAQNGAPIAIEALRRIGELYAIEKEIRGQAPEARLRARAERSRPIVEAMKPWLEAQLGRLSKGSRLAEAIRYALPLWDGLTRFLDDGRLELDTNAVERTIRPIALNRKNALFAGSDEGAANWGIIASLIETAKLNGVEPHAYIASTLTALVNGHPAKRINELMPWARSTSDTVSRVA